VADSVEALRVIGATESAEFLSQALAIYHRYGWPDDWESCLNFSPEDEAEVERLSNLRCNDRSSKRDYALLEAYLRQHLDECVVG
jgi:hypothetical protein